MSSKVALLFPGQGSQKIGMGKDLYESSKVVKEVFDEADDILNYHFTKMIFSGDPKELQLTENTQPALLTMSVACMRLINENLSFQPSFVAGHSLGEYSALVASGGLSFAEALKTTKQRGLFMQEAVPQGQGAMAAVIGMEPQHISEILDNICSASKDEYVAVANFNGPKQTVISGYRKGVLKAMTALKESKARLVKELPVSAPFHCDLMMPAQIKLSEVLSTLKYNDLSCPLIANVDAQPYTAALHIPERLTTQVTSSVRFTEMVNYMFAQNIDCFVEVGNGKTLSGIMKRMDKERKYLNVGDISSFEKTLKEF